MKDLPFNVITRSVINQIVVDNLPKIYELIRSTYIHHQEENISNPKSSFLRFTEKPNARIIALPAYINQTESQVSGIKWISSYPDNIKSGRQRASAVIILNDFQTGYPFACMEGSVISAVRTACSAVLAAEHIHSQQKSTPALGIVGNGFIAKQICDIFISLNWKIDQLYLFDKNITQSQRFCDELRPTFSQPITITHSPEELIKQSQTIVFTTTELQPYITDPAIFQHNPSVLHISLRDLAPEILINANNVVDNIEHVLDANTSPHLTFQQYQTKNFITGTLVDLILKKCSLEPNRPTIFSPMGMGILDLVLGDLIYKIAMSEGKTQAIDNFF